MGKTRLFQVFAAREEQAGVLASGLIAIANAKVQVKDPRCTYDIEQYERVFNRGSLSPLTTISGIVQAQITFSVEMSGSTVGTAATSVASGRLPVWSQMMEACGMQQKTLRRMQLAATFGGTAKVFEQGERIYVGADYATATKRGIVIHDTWEGQTFIRYYDTGSANIALADTITGDTNGATATFVTSANAEEGVGWFPGSQPEITLDYASITGATSANDVLKGNTSGAIVASIGDLGAGPVAGVPFRPLDGTLSSGETLTNLTQTGTVVNVTGFSQSKLPTLSIACVEDGKVKTLKGCRGTFTITAEIGQPVMINFTFKGQLSSITDGGSLSGVAYESPVPPKFMGHEFKIGSYAASEPGKDTYTTEHTPRVTSFSFDFGNEISFQKDATNATGIVGVHLTGRKTKGTINPEIRPEAVFPLERHFKDGSPFRERITIGNTAGNRFYISAGGCKPTQSGVGDRDGFGINDYAFDCSVYRHNGAEGDERELVISYSNVAQGW